MSQKKAFELKREIDRCRQSHQHFGLGDYPHHRYKSYVEIDNSGSGNFLIYYDRLSNCEAKYLFEKIKYLKRIDIAYYFGSLGFGLNSLLLINQNKQILTENVE